jgi:hypothetical protein
VWATAPSTWRGWRSKPIRVTMASRWPGSSRSDGPSTASRAGVPLWRTRSSVGLDGVASTRHGSIPGCSSKSPWASWTRRVDGLCELVRPAPAVPGRDPAIDTIKMGPINAPRGGQAQCESCRPDRSPLLGRSPPEGSQSSAPVRRTGLSFTHRLGFDGSPCISCVPAR